MSQKPTLILVPGAWHSPDTWNKVTSLLNTQQYKTVSVTLPSTLSDPSSTFSDDIKAVRDPIVAETTKGRDVVVVVHSYGGAVGSSAVRGLTRLKQDVASPKEASSGHVIGIIMIASGFVVTGVGFLEGLGGKPPPLWTLDPSGFAVLVGDPRELFYHDLPIEEGSDWVGRLKQQASGPMTEGGKYYYSGWKDVPVWYLVTMDDKVHPIPIQRFFVQAAKDAGADVTMRDIYSSHSPMLSKPNETVDLILEAVAYFVGQKG